MHPLETYLRQMHTVRATGAVTRELSYYSPLAALLEAAGQGLRPKVRCVMNLHNQGAGLPDGGFFTTDQLQDTSEEGALKAQVPGRGVLEVKPLSHDLRVLSQTEQVSRYRQRYRLVLLTNYREFLLIGQNEVGEPVFMESYTIAEREGAFWEAAIHPESLIEAHGERLLGYLQRVLTHTAPLADPQDLAWLLASYARDARIRVEKADLANELDLLRGAFEDTLGLHIAGEKGDRFFLSSTIQTLFYGLFSAWVLWHREHPQRQDNFSWHGATAYLNVPIIGRLFYQLIEPKRLRRLKLAELLNWATAALNRVDRPVFFEKFGESDAVHYFYEPFLEAFDAELRRALGVWYTPREVVRYMVRRVDTVLREELGLRSGLADPSVVVLDPCCGTGAYLVEVLQLIASTLRDQGEGALLGAELKAVAQKRIRGFEILTAPFVVAHLQLGLLMRNYGVPFRVDDEAPKKNERASVYLTNALTDWKLSQKQETRLPFPELEEERTAARQIKQNDQILVILGNPPYNGYAGVAIAEERDLSATYRTTRHAPKPQGQGLNDLYVRYYRMAERQIVEKTGRGVVCFITNYSWLDGLSHTGMRERYLEVFDKVWIDNLNGDKYRTGKTTPEGKPDPSIFSTRYNREGIQVGTAIALLARSKPDLRSGTPSGTDTVYYRDLWGKGKATCLTKTAPLCSTEHYEAVKPSAKLGYPFMPRRHEDAYLGWYLLPTLFTFSSPGIITARDSLLVDVDREALEERMRYYFDPAVSWSRLKTLCPAAVKETRRFAAKSTRQHLLNRGFLPQRVVKYGYRPFDVRWLYWEPETKLVEEKRAEFFPHVFGGNLWLSASQRHRRAYSPPVVMSQVGAFHLFERATTYFPLYLAPETADTDLFDHPETTLNAADIGGKEPSRARTNLSKEARWYLETIDAAPEALFFHVVAILHAPAYGRENSGALRQDWPRIPLLWDEPDLLQQSAELGQRIVRLLDMDGETVSSQGDPYSTPGDMAPDLRFIAQPAHIAGRPWNPEAGHFDVTARWGYASHHGAIMPGKGRAVERAYTAEERAALPETVRACLGVSPFDVYLNEETYWKNIPARVWNYRLGGYPVIKKWLSYRERALLGRSLRPDEVRTVMHMARRIAAIRLLEGALDANYEAVKEAARAPRSYALSLTTTSGVR